MLWFSLIFAIATGLVLFDDAIGITDEIKTNWKWILSKAVTLFCGALLLIVVWKGLGVM
jgi:hypothetical protein